MPDKRTYIRVHDGMPDHPKIETLSDKAFRLLIETWCWCSRYATDGRIPAAAWSRRGTKKVRDELLSAGLVEDHGAHVTMHDYLEHQRSAEQIAEAVESKRRGGALGSHRRWHVNGVTDPHCEFCPPVSPTDPPPEPPFEPWDTDRSTHDTTHDSTHQDPAEQLDNGKEKISALGSVVDIAKGFTASPSESDAIPHPTSEHHRISDDTPDRSTHGEPMGYSYTEDRGQRKEIEEPLRGSSTTRSRGSRLPEDFHPTEAMIAWARQHTPLVGRAETDRFVDYWRAVPGARGRKLDWIATWRNWMRKAQDDAERHQTRTPRRPNADDTIRDLLAPTGTGEGAVVLQLPRGAT